MFYRRSGVGFHQRGDVEAIVLIRQPGLFKTAACVAVLRQKGGDLFLVFSVQHRTGDVGQASARCQQGPEGIEQLALHLHDLVDVFGAAQELDVGMPPQHTGAAAGGVEQDAREGLAIPPGRRLARVRLAQGGAEAEAAEVVGDALQALCILIESEQIEVEVFEHVRRLTARSGAGVEDALSGLQVEAGEDALGMRILDADPAFLPERQAADVMRLFQKDGVVSVSDGAGGDAGGVQMGEIVIAPATAGVDAQA